MGAFSLWFGSIEVLQVEQLSTPWPTLCPQLQITVVNYSGVFQHLACHVTHWPALRRDLVNVPARFGAPARKTVLHLPVHWPSQNGWETLCPNVIGYRHPTRQPESTD